MPKKSKQVEETNEFIIRAMEHNDGCDTVVLEPRTWDAAIVGNLELGGALLLVYSEKKIIQYFMKVDGMKRDEAQEFFEYNTMRALPYMTGPKTIAPVILRDL